MPAKSRRPPPTGRRQLAATIATRLRDLADRRLADLVDADAVRELIAHWDTRVVDRTALAEVAVAANRRGAARLARRRETLAGLLDPALLDQLDATVAAQLELTPRARAALRQLIEHPIKTGRSTDMV